MQRTLARTSNRSLSVGSRTRRVAVALLVGLLLRRSKRTKHGEKIRTRQPFSGSWCSFWFFFFLVLQELFSERE